MRTWQLRNQLWSIPATGGVMGILNITPDSFSDGGRFLSSESAIEQAHLMIQQGAHILDIGGESTRPGAIPVEPAEETQRIIPVISALRQKYPSLLISADTRHAEVAAAALDAGADIINDITGLTSPDMLALCASRPCGIILMHMQGTPQTMQLAPTYTDVVAEVRNFFIAQVQQAMQHGIAPARICLDPGIGFGKSTQHNLALIRHVEALRYQDLPIMMALSRKRFIGELLADPIAAKNSPVPTTVMSLLAADAGADLHRVHDVEPLCQALSLRAHLRSVPAEDTAR